MLQLILNASAESAEAIADFLTENDALAVSLQDAGNEPLFQEILHSAPVWQNTQIRALFADDAPIDQLMQTLKAQFNSLLDWQIHAVAEENWVEKTQQSFPARCFGGKLWIIPSGNVLRINPGLGFGTGAIEQLRSVWNGCRSRIYEINP